MLMFGALAAAASPGPEPAGNVTDGRAADSSGDNWLVKGGSFAQQQFSPLRQITDQNIGKLGVAWVTELDNPMGLTAEPIVVDGVIYLSAPRSIAAFDAETGKELWRFWTVPGDPAKGFESKALEMAAKTWSGPQSWQQGGGTAWYSITFDPETGLLLFGTSKSFRDEGPKGQETAGGATRHVAMTAPRNGSFYVLDAATGELISQKPMVPKGWVTSPGGSPAEQMDYSGVVVGGVEDCPGGGCFGVRNWWPMSYNPVTQLTYVPIMDRRASARRE
jgi:quinohemoprotein ethanol dehydrogenase